MYNAIFHLPPMHAKASPIRIQALHENSLQRVFTRFVNKKHNLQAANNKFLWAAMKSILSCP